ncbi:MAG TPA: PhzF family phenazine biosynthesis protein [Steroidobacteraceae bacterium]|nr:PhzF family phenazine biosynthesis protein [Steroidobacteraceae bacterium]
MKTQYDFHTLDVFTQKRFGGNPLAVFPDAIGLDSALMQTIAGEMNLSETVFVQPPADTRAHCKVRIFTPARELPFAGHPTVGTGYLLATLGRIPLREERTTVLFEEGVGLVPVEVRTRDGKADFVQLTAAKLPEFGPSPPDRMQLAAMLHIQPDDILDGVDRPQAASCGVPFLFVPVRDRGVLARAAPDTARWRAALGDYWAREVFVFCRDPELPGSNLRARMFAPEAGITEDPATGGACAALGGYLGVRATIADGTLHWVVEQGFEMKRPSLLHIETDLKGGRIAAVRVGGHSVLVSQGTLRLDS